MSAEPDWSLIATFEDVLPKYMMAAGAARMKEDGGYEIREDIEQALTVGFVSALPTDPIQKAQITTRLENITSSLFREIVASNPTTGFIGICSWVLKLVDRQVFLDPGSVAGATALLFIEEARDDPQGWLVNWSFVDSTSEKLFTTCRLNGLYLSEVEIPS